MRGVPRILPDAFEQNAEFTRDYYDSIKKYQGTNVREKEHFEKMFKEDPENPINAFYLAENHKQSESYNEVVVLDEYAMNYVIELTNINPQLPPVPPTESTFCKPWDDPQHCHDIQHNILETLCAPPQNILEYTNFIRVFDLVSDHLKATLSQNDILDFWQINFGLDTPPTISCKIYP